MAREGNYITQQYTFRHVETARAFAKSKRKAGFHVTVDGRTVTCRYLPRIQQQGEQN